MSPRYICLNFQSLVKLAINGPGTPLKLDPYLLYANLNTNNTATIVHGYVLTTSSNVYACSGRVIAILKGSLTTIRISQTQSSGQGWTIRRGYGVYMKEQSVCGDVRMSERCDCWGRILWVEVWVIHVRPIGSTRPHAALALAGADRLIAAPHCIAPFWWGKVLRMGNPKTQRSTEDSRIQSG